MAGPRSGWRTTKSYSFGFTRLSGLGGGAVLSGKEVQAILFGEPCSGMAHKIQMLAGLLLPPSSA